MQPTHTHKWTAFWLSLAVPGAGQLLAGSPTALAWMAAAGVLGAIFLSPAASWRHGALVLVEFPVLAAVSLFSAWHARSLLERVPPWPATGGACASVECGGGRGRTIHARVRIATALSREEIWRRISDLPTFLTIDPFHERVTLMRAAPQAGVDLVLHHNALGRRFDRFGRVLWWREQDGFAFSDLSARGAARGFPHLFIYRIEAGDATSGVLLMEIKGRWTARFIPARLGRWWIAAVCRYHARLLRAAF